MRKILSIIGILLILLLPLGSTRGVQIRDTDSSDTSIQLRKISSDITTMLTQVNTTIITYYLEKFVSFGFKKIGSENCRNTAEWIHQEFETLGYYTYFDNWRFPRYKDRNVIAYHNGTNPDSDAVILISAHYDTIGHSPGANDDGSGIAAMLVIANITKNYGFNHTIRFIAVSGEEVGTYGSFADAKKAYSKGENIIAMLNLDMIGYANKSDEHIVQLFCPQRSQWIVDFTKDIAKKYASTFQITPQHTLHYPADHESYNDFGYDGVQFIQPKPEDATWFHTPADSLDKITYPYLLNVTKLVLAVTCELANHPIIVQVQIIRPKEAYVYFLSIPVKRLPCLNLYFTRIRALTYLYGRTTVELNITTNEQINSVYFGIDGYVRHIVNEPPYEWKIGTELYKFFRLKGFHRITVCVTTNMGNTAFDEMDVYIIKRI